MSARSSRASSSRSSFIYPSASPTNFLSFESHNSADLEPDETESDVTVSTVTPSTGKGYRPDYGQGDPVYSSSKNRDLIRQGLSFDETTDSASSSGDERYLETRLSDLEGEDSLASASSTAALRRQLVPYTGPEITRAIMQQENMMPHENNDYNAIEYNSHKKHALKASSPELLALEDPEKELTEDQKKIRREMARIRHLDKILAKKQKMANRAKRDRVALQRHVVSEMELLTENLSDRTPSREEAVNTNKYLALVRNDIRIQDPVIENHENGTDRQENEVKPVFATQPEFEDEQIDTKSRSKSVKSDKLAGAGVKHKKKKDADSSSLGSERSKSSTSVNGSHTGSNSSKMTNDTDFIDRNKKLAADAANVIPMTPDERSRLNDILKDVDLEDDLGESAWDQSNVQYTNGSNPSLMTSSEMKALQEIDYKLSGYLSLDMYREICCAPKREIQMSSESKGDDKIRETREDRISQIRLAHIEEKLKRLRNAAIEDSEETASNVSQQQIQLMIKDLMSRESEENTSALLPKPSEAQMKSLLQECRPATSFDSWSYVQSKPNSRSSIRQSDLAVTNVDEFFTDESTNTDNFMLPIEYNPSSKAVQRGNQLAEDISSIEIQSDQVLRKLNNLPVLEEVDFEAALERSAKALALTNTSFSCDDFEQRDRLYELDRDMQYLKDKLSHLNKLRDDTLSHLPREKSEEELDK